MQLAMKINNRTTRAAVGGKGFVIASVSLSFSKNEEDANATASISGYEFEPRQMSKWNVGNLAIGDKIEIEILPGKDSDPPTETHQNTAAGPRLLFSAVEHAQKALAEMHVCNEHLQGILQVAKYAEPHDEALEIQRAVAKVVQELSRFLIMPTLRRHPELTPEAKSLGLLD
jgi:hypothetical protein